HVSHINFLLLSKYTKYLPIIQRKYEKYRNNYFALLSSREFRANQKSYFDRVDSGEEIIVQRKGDKSYKILPISEDDTLMSKSEFIEKINTSIREIKEGKATTLKGDEEIANFLATL
ncbi:MAG: hypothetical protein SNI87_04625, partial [Rikenellaceae bacterium]